MPETMQDVFWDSFADELGKFAGKFAPVTAQILSRGRFELTKNSSQFRVTANIFRRMGAQRMGDSIERGGRRLSGRVYRALNYKIPGTGKTRLPGLTDSRRRRLTHSLAGNPHLLPLAPTPVLEVGAVATAAGNRLAGKLNTRTLYGRGA